METALLKTFSDSSVKLDSSHQLSPIAIRSKLTQLKRAVGTIGIENIEYKHPPYFSLVENRIEEVLTEDSDLFDLESRSPGSFMIQRIVLRSNGENNSQEVLEKLKKLYHKSCLSYIASYMILLRKKETELRNNDVSDPDHHFWINGSIRELNYTYKKYRKQLQEHIAHVISKEAVRLLVQTFSRDFLRLMLALEKNYGSVTISDLEKLWNKVIFIEDFRKLLELNPTAPKSYMMQRLTHHNPTGEMKMLNFEERIDQIYERYIHDGQAIIPHYIVKVMYYRAKSENILVKHLDEAVRQFQILSNTKPFLHCPGRLIRLLCRQMELNPGVDLQPEDLIGKKVDKFVITDESVPISQYRSVMVSKSFEMKRRIKLDQKLQFISLLHSLGLLVIPPEIKCFEQDQILYILACSYRYVFNDRLKINFEKSTNRFLTKDIPEDFLPRDNYLVVDKDIYHICIHALLNFQKQSPNPSSENSFAWQEAIFQDYSKHFTELYKRRHTEVPFDESRRARTNTLLHHCENQTLQLANNENPYQFIEKNEMVMQMGVEENLMDDMLDIITKKILLFVSTIKDSDLVLILKKFLFQYLGPEKIIGFEPRQLSHLREKEINYLTFLGKNLIMRFLIEENMFDHGHFTISPKKIKICRELTYMETPFEIREFWENNDLDIELFSTKKYPSDQGFFNVLWKEAAHLVQIDDFPEINEKKVLIRTPHSHFGVSLVEQLFEAYKQAWKRRVHLLFKKMWLHQVQKVYGKSNEGDLRNRWSDYSQDINFIQQTVASNLLLLGRGSLIDFYKVFKNDITNLIFAITTELTEGVRIGDFVVLMNRSHDQLYCRKRLDLFKVMEVNRNKKSKLEIKFERFNRRITLIHDLYSKKIISLPRELIRYPLDEICVVLAASLFRGKNGEYTLNNELYSSCLIAYLEWKSSLETTIDSLKQEVFKAKNMSDKAYYSSQYSEVSSQAIFYDGSERDVFEGLNFAHYDQEVTDFEESSISEMIAKENRQNQLIAQLFDYAISLSAEHEILSAVLIAWMKNFLNSNEYSNFPTLEELQYRYKLTDAQIQEHVQIGSQLLVTFATDNQIKLEDLF